MGRYAPLSFRCLYPTILRGCAPEPLRFPYRAATLQFYGGCAPEPQQNIPHS